VNDEWYADLLRVTFDTQKITVKQLIEKIAQEGLEAAVKEGP
jgi:hypothetical protein